MKYFWTTFAALLLSAEAFAWQGINLDTGSVIEIRVDEGITLTEGNIEYYDYELGEIKLGYLNMYEQNMGLIVDLDTGELLRVRMSPVEASAQ